MRAASIVVLLTITLAVGLPARATDPVRGKRLHDNACVFCHDTSMYSRSEGKVRSFEALREEVRVWAGEAMPEWGQNEVDDIARYLNDTFFQFSCPDGRC